MLPIAALWPFDLQQAFGLLLTPLLGMTPMCQLLYVCLLPVVTAAAAWVTVVASSSSVSSPVVELMPAKALALLPT
jgi:hypothetical protein